jgi:two-component sensor histidine kinase
MNHLDFSQYMPHGMCLLWQPWLVSLWVLSDLLISVSYFAIPFALLKVTRARPDIRHRGIVLLFAGFITLCGITHVLSIVTLWLPIYPPMGWVKLATGLVSMATAVVLFRLVPVFKAIPSPSQLEAANADLRDAIAAHEATLADLRRMRDELEERVSDRTSELERANDTIAVAMREAVHRSTNLLTVVLALARQSARGANSLEGFLKAFTGRIEALSRATASVGQDGPAGGADLGRVLRVQLDPLVLTFGDRLRIEGPPVEVGPSAAQQFSLVVHELGTNAGKYGALAGEEGRVDLNWAMEEGEDGQQLRLVWRESGVPIDGPQVEPPGFGTRLLGTIVPGVLRGKAERSFDRGGLVYELTVPFAGIAPTSYAAARPDGPGFMGGQPA